MKTKELIAKLSEFDPEMDVVIVTFRNMGHYPNQPAQEVWDEVEVVDVRTEGGTEGDTCVVIGNSDAIT